MLTPTGAGGRRSRRGSSLPVLLVLLGLLAAAALAWGGWTAWQAYAEDEPTRAAGSGTSCPPPSTSPPAVPADQVRVNVYNSTDRKGLAARVAKKLERRGFTVGGVDNDPLERAVAGVAEVRHGPRGGEPGRTLGAHLGEVVTVPMERRGAAVDLALGAGFTGLLPLADAEAALTPPPAERPAGC